MQMRLAACDFDAMPISMYVLTAVSSFVITSIGELITIWIEGSSDFSGVELLPDMCSIRTGMLWFEAAAILHQIAFRPWATLGRAVHGNIISILSFDLEVGS